MSPRPCRNAWALSALLVSLAPACRASDAPVATYTAPVANCPDDSETIVLKADGKFSQVVTMHDGDKTSRLTCDGSWQASDAAGHKLKASPFPGTVDGATVTLGPLYVYHVFRERSPLKYVSGSRTMPATSFKIVGP